MKRNFEQRVYELAWEFLLEKVKPFGITETEIKKYLTPEQKDRPNDLNGIFKRILESAKNTDRKEKVIKNIDNLGKILFRFNPKKTIQHYGMNYKMLIENLDQELDNKVKQNDRGIWTVFAKTILTAAEFLSSFASGKEFYEWVEKIYEEEKSRIALPLILSNAITGLGFALSCDFLKELGYTEFGKPDTHIKYIFRELGLLGDVSIYTKSSLDYHYHQAILRLAKSVKPCHGENITPYAVDKLFWLIGSRYFYKHPKIGKDGRINAWRKEDFIRFVKNKLKIDL